MHRKDEPAAFADAAGSGDVLRFPAKRPHPSRSLPADQRRRRALRWLVDALVMGADEAPNRDSALALRDAAARVADALNFELGRRP